MRDAALIDRVRRLVSQAFAEAGVAEPADVRETILVRDGYYCGRRFESDTATAVWFLEENQIKVYQANGHVVRVLELGGVSVRAAA